jgi:hypothetical protein
MTRAKTKTYTTLDEEVIILSDLDEQEQRLAALLRKRARTHPSWIDFDNFWMKKVGEFYDARGVSRVKSRATEVFRIAQDLSGRLGIASGLVRLDDYRGDLEELIREKFRTQRAFCEATGLAEDMISHVLAGRKHLAIDTLEEALNRIGYTLRIRPLPKIDIAEPTKTSKTKRRSAS